MSKEMNVLGIMSGSSLDGIDLALVKLSFDNNEKLQFKMISTGMYDYSNSLREELKIAHSLPIRAYVNLNARYSRFIASLIDDFINDNELQVDLIGIHGHTIYHSPEMGISQQMGHAGIIAQLAKCPCIGDFRTQDMIENGQGAPMAALIDSLVYSEYQGCINLGGIANATFTADKDNIKAYDICAFNQISNFLAQQMGLSYDDGGELGKKGTIHYDLLSKLKKDPFIKKAIPKSLDNQELRDFYRPIFQEFSFLDIEDQLRTFYEHIVEVFNQEILSSGIGNQSKILITGGGAKNQFFIDLLRKKMPNMKFVIPDENTMEFKEAALIALAAYLRFHHKTNFISAASGAHNKVSSGALYICN